MVEIGTLSIGDPVELWERLGFVLNGTTAWIGSVGYELAAPGAGVGAWRLWGAGALTELPVQSGPAPMAVSPPSHPNDVAGLDHVVIATPHVRRTIEAFETAGVALRRTRDAGTAQRPMIQAFFRLGDTIAEVVGSPTEAGPGPARFFGLAFTVADLDATAAFLGPHLRAPKAAVQPGRQIATLDRAAGSTVAMAFMSADPSPRHPD